jgi:hypothetical protein
VPDPIRLEIVPRTAEADPETIAYRADTVERLRDLGQLDGTGEVSTTVTATTWSLRFGAVEIPLEAFEVRPPEEGGRSMVSVVIAADSVQVGAAADSPVALPQPEAPPVWGAPGRPDPREGIPGWTPEAAAGQEPVVLDERPAGVAEGRAR